MKFERFEDIVSWQKGKELALFALPKAQSIRDFSFRDQFSRAVLSIMNNIAEGFERSSNKEFKYFLFVAKGSAAEVRSMLVVAESMHHLSREDCKRCHELCLEISKTLSGLITYLRGFEEQLERVDEATLRTL